MNAMAPNFVGARFDRLPYVSAMGLLLRAARLNYYEARDYQFAFGVRVSRHDDQNIIMAFSERRKQQLAEALQVPDSLQPYWRLENWLPYQSDPPPSSQGYAFRYCPECLYCGFHTLLHQLPWVDHCPWHGATLRTTCVRCERPLRMRLSDGPWLGVCRCGHDHIGLTSALRGPRAPDVIARMIDSYLIWAAHQREQTVLLAPVPAANSWTVLSDQFAVPPLLSRRLRQPCAAEHVHAVTVRAEPREHAGTEDPVAAIAKLEGLHQSGSAMIEAPGRLAHRIARIGYRLASLLPAGSLSDTEMTLFLKPLGSDASESFVPARRPSIVEIRTLPLACVAGRRFLDLHCITQVVRLAGYRVLQLAQVDLRRSTDNLAVAVSAATEVLAHGYSEGIRIAIGHHVPDLYAARRNRPHLSEPWILAYRKHGELQSVRILWARIEHTPD